MRWYHKLLIAICLLAVPSQVLALNAKNLRENETPVSARCVATDGITFAACAGGVANASAPAPSEGASVAPSFDLANNLRVTLGTCISGESACNGTDGVSYLRTTGALVRTVAVMTGVSTNTSSTPIAGYMGNKTFSGTLVCNAGGSTNCGITYTIWGSMTNSNTAGVSLCTVVIPTGSATTYGDCAGVVTASYAYLYAITTGVAGTTPSLTITMGY